MEWRSAHDVVMPSEASSAHESYIAAKDLFWILNLENRSQEKYSPPTDGTQMKEL